MFYLSLFHELYIPDTLMGIVLYEVVVFLNI